MKLTLICEICTHHVASVDTKRLSLPLSGEMFAPPTPAYPEPFPAGQPWEFMRCGMCQKRPFIEEGRFKSVERGYFGIKDGLRFESFQPDMSYGEHGLEAEVEPSAIVDSESFAEINLNPTKEPERIGQNARILELHREGKKPGEIGKEVDLHHMTVVNRLKQMGEWEQ